MNTIASIIIDQEVTHAEQLAKSLRAVTQEIFASAKPAVDSPDTDTIRQHQIRQLKSREAQLQAELNDTRERIAILECDKHTRFPNAA